LTTLTVGIPSIALATWARAGRSPRGSVTQSLLHFVLPAALTLALAGIAVYVFVALTTHENVAARAQTALTVLSVPCGLLLLPFVEPPTRWWAGGDTVSGDWRPTFLAGGLFLSFVLLLVIAPLRSFFGLVPLDLTSYLVIACIVLVWAILLRVIWRLRLLERFLGIDLQASAVQ
ncbi:MAG TPA: haloacid dehalogenase, partial [Chloroflexota bacterium]